MRKWVVLASAALGLAGLVALLLSRVPRLPPGTERTIARIRAGPVTGVVNGKSGYAQSGPVRIWYESIPPVGGEKGVLLLNSSLGVGSLFWPPAFLRALSAAGYRVVRYDYRGTGASSWMTSWSRKHPYSLIEMAKDSIAVLDELGIDRVHLLGLSLGGFVAQEIAIAYPERVDSLTLHVNVGGPNRRIHARATTLAADPIDVSGSSATSLPLARRGNKSSEGDACGAGGARRGRSCRR